MGEVSLEELRASGGKPARAMITNAKSGRKLKGDPSQIVWKVTLRVTPDDAGPFDATLQVPFPASKGGPSLGSLIGVVYDPHNHSKLAVDPTAETASWGQLQAGMQQHMVDQAMHKAGTAVFVGGQWIGGNSPVAQPASAAAPPPAAPSGGLADELERLATLRDQGALTDAEFQAQKAKLLGT
jgi:Short C-terminal domain